MPFGGGQRVRGVFWRAPLPGRGEYEDRGGTGNRGVVGGVRHVLWLVVFSGWGEFKDRGGIGGG